jgi:hypothetical protein
MLWPDSSSVSMFFVFEFFIWFALELPILETVLYFNVAMVQFTNLAFLSRFCGFYIATVVMNSILTLIA